MMVVGTCRSNVEASNILFADGTRASAIQDYAAQPLHDDTQTRAQGIRHSDPHQASPASAGLVSP
jgi:prepilin-type processing-associated H-X9-DG protein